MASNHFSRNGSTSTLLGVYAVPNKITQNFVKRHVMFLYQLPPCYFHHQDDHPPVYITWILIITCICISQNFTYHDSKASHEDTVVRGETMSTRMLELFPFNIPVKDPSTAWSYAAPFPRSGKTRYPIQHLSQRSTHLCAWSWWTFTASGMDFF
jgi:hypothetical protein